MPVEFVHDIHDPRLSPFAGMRDAQLRGDEGAGPGLFIGESEKVINRALDAGVQPVSLFLEEKWLPKTDLLIRRIADIDPALSVLVADKHDFQAVTGYEVTRGAVAALRRPALPAARALLADAHRIVVLEDVMNATNIGATFRSAAALGMDAVLLNSRSHDPLYRRAARVSMGTIFQVPWTRVEDDFVSLLHECGFCVVAMALTPEALPLDDGRLRGHDRLALVMGNEQNGIAPRTLAACDHAAVIPMAHGVDSLNVAAASAVAFWELRRKR